MITNETLGCYALPPAPWTSLKLEFTMTHEDPSRVANVRFKYYGITVTGIQVTYDKSVSMFIIEMPRAYDHHLAVYFHDPTERERFYFDVLYTLNKDYGAEMRAILGGRTA